MTEEKNVAEEIKVIPEPEVIPELKLNGMTSNNYKIGTYLKYIRPDDFVDVISIMAHNPTCTSKFWSYVFIKILDRFGWFRGRSKVMDGKRFQMTKGRIVSPFNPGMVVAEKVTINIVFHACQHTQCYHERSYEDDIVAQTFAEAWDMNGYALPDLIDLFVTSAVIEQQKQFVVAPYSDCHMEIEIITE